jgi:hypothetical protein
VEARAAEKKKDEKAKREAWKHEKEGGTGPACASGIAGDGTRQECESFCSETSGQAQCAWCKYTVGGHFDSTL